MTQFLDAILDHYRDYTLGELSTLTHLKSTPREQVTRNYLKADLECGTILVPTDVIQKYYKSAVEDFRAREC